MNRMKSHFTLVELLVVIGIIIILAGILLPVTQSALKKADNTKALAQIKALESAIVQFKTDFGYYPDNSSYDSLIELLQNDRTDSKSGNTRNTRYLDILEGDPGTYTDPWDHNFIIVMDNEDGVYDTDGYNGVIDKLYIEGVYDKNDDKVDDYYYSIIIFSLGADGKGGADSSAVVLPTDDDKEKHNADNIYSFPNSYNKKTKKHTITK